MVKNKRFVSLVLFLISIVLLLAGGFVLFTSIRVGMESQTISTYALGIIVALIVWFISGMLIILGGLMYKTSKNK